ncbi:MAG: hypothetical protein IJW82_06235, partial [Clostridia bacterium]|nr:hypothetical protein [Clostridia bacterium]
SQKLGIKNYKFKVFYLVKDDLDKSEKFDFIYSIAVLHMLCEDEDRKAFFKFLKSHLNKNRKALICVLGDGKTEFVSDYQNAFMEKDRFHKQSNQNIKVASTSLKIVTKENLFKEIYENEFCVLEYFIETKIPGFSEMMSVVIENKI